jgi:hypothetical protein
MKLHCSAASEFNIEAALTGELGCAIARVAGRQFPTAAALFDLRLIHVVFVADKFALGQYIGFPCQFLFHVLLNIY